MITKKYTKKPEVISVYQANPSVATAQRSLTSKIQKVYSNSDGAMLVGKTGEVLGSVGTVFIRKKVVDTEQFIKVYSGFVDGLIDLTSASLKVFKLIYGEVLNTPNLDSITLDYHALKTLGKWEWTQYTFISGINGLLVKEIIFKSVYTNQYFINVNYFFNGDRIGLIELYEREKSQIQGDLLEELEY